MTLQQYSGTVATTSAYVGDRPPVLLFQRIADTGIALLSEHFTVHHLWDAEDADALLRRVGSSIRAVLTGANKGIPTAMVEALPNLEIISIHGVGLNAVDLEHARSRGIRVTYTPDVLTEDVADQAIALAMAALRRIPQGDRFVRDGEWSVGHVAPLGRKMTGKRLGILGMGRIGSAIASRAAAFRMEIAYTNRRVRSDSPYRHEPDLKALATWCDVLMVAAPAVPGAPPLVDAAVLDALGPDGFLVNVGRGALVDEDALVAALQDGRIAGAGLDVFANEPHVPAALRALDNVVLAPHYASATVETRNAMAEESVQHLIDHFAGRTPQHVVA